MPKQKIDAQFFLDNAKRGVLNLNPVGNLLQTGIMSAPYVWGGLTNVGKTVNTAVDAVPGAKEVINHPATGVLTLGNPTAQAVVAGIGATTQIAGGQKFEPPKISGSTQTTKTPKPSRTGSVDTSTPYPTEAVTETIKPSRDYQQEASGGSGGGRTNSEGLVQYGQTLGGLNTFNKGFLGEGYDLTDIKATYQSEALPATLAGVTQLSKPISEGMAFDRDIDVSYSDKPPIAYDAKLPDSTKPFASVDTYTPYSTGGNPDNAQDGASPKPDRVERIRQVAFNGADFSGDEPDDSTLVSPMYANKKRNAIRDVFLDPSMSSVKASVAANALAGYGKDSNGRARFNVGGELVYAKEGMQQQAKHAASMGVDPSEFLQMKVAEVKETPEVTPTVADIPAPSTSAVMTPGLTLEGGNAEYGAMKFVRDPKTNSMVPAK